MSNPAPYPPNVMADILEASGRAVQTQAAHALNRAEAKSDRLRIAREILAAVIGTASTMLMVRDGYSKDDALAAIKDEIERAAKMAGERL